MGNGVWTKWGDSIKIAISFGSVLVLLMGVNFAVVQWIVGSSEARLLSEIKEIKKAVERIDERLDSFGERIAKNETRLNAN